MPKTKNVKRKHKHKQKSGKCAKVQGTTDFRTVTIHWQIQKQEEGKVGRSTAKATAQAAGMMGLTGNEPDRETFHKFTLSR